MLNSLDCKLRAAECEKLAEGAPNPRVQATLRDMSRTWTRLALEAEQTLKQSRPPLQLIVPGPPSFTAGAAEFLNWASPANRPDR